MKTLGKLAALVTLVATPSLVTAGSDLPKQVADMECVVGTWKATGTLTMGKDTAKVSATWTCKRTPGNYGVMCNLNLTGIPGLAVYNETDLFGYDPGTDTYHWFSVTNGGETHDHVAKRSDSNKLQFLYTGTMEGKPFKEVIDMEFGKPAGKSKLPATIAIRSEQFVGGQSAGVLDMKARR